jgi:hypothetical protein
MYDVGRREKVGCRVILSTVIQVRLVWIRQEDDEFKTAATGAS